MLAAQVLLASTTGLAAQRPAGAVVGRVVVAEGELGRTEAVLPSLGRRVAVSSTGQFRFDDVPPGEHVLLVESVTAGRAARTVEVRAGEESLVEIVLAEASHSEEIVVTGTAETRSALDLAGATSVLRGEELQLRLQSSLGETLESQAGISSTFFGPGASRPIVRGQSGDRVRILEGGIGVGDASAISPDHAVASDPSLAEQIEVLRGPATLLYGSSAIGGAVNVVDERVPSLRPTGGVDGTVDLRGGSADDLRAAAVGVAGGSGRFAWTLGGALRATDDYDIPGFARIGEASDRDDGDSHEVEEHENPFGVVPNTDSESRSARAGASWFFGEAGFVGAAVTGFESEYGVPAGAHHGDGAEEPADAEALRIDMDQRRFDLRAERTRPIGPFQGIRTRLGASDYEHVELEGGLPGTRFSSDLVEARVELVHRPRGRASGASGVQLYERELDTVGDEAYLPQTDTSRWALFSFHELRAGSVRWQLGARYERQRNEPRTGGFEATEHDGLSASAGLVWDASETWSVAVSAARAVKMPAPEELFSNGPHAATRSFEVGDPLLEEESALGVDVSLRRTQGRLTGELTVFRNDFDDYIFPAFTGAVEDGLQLVRYEQHDAELAGAELEARIELLAREPHHLHLRLTGDVVDAELRSGEELPRTPPARLGAGLDYHGGRVNAIVEVRRVFDQDDVAVDETPTGGYTMLNASLGYRFVIGERLVDVLLRGRNLTNEEARVHTSFLKDLAPLPGRDVGLALRWWF